MKLVELSVKRPVTGIMAFICLTILGLFTFSRLELDLLPKLEFPVVAIIATYEGAGPDAVEQLVTRPIEAAMASVENVETVTSTSSQGTSIVLVELAWGTNMDQADQDVRKNLELFALDFLPADVDRPTTFAFDPSLQPVLTLVVNAPGTAEQVRKLAEDDVQPYLERIPGVAAAELMGGSEREIEVRLRPEWLEAYSVSPSQVVNALRAANVVVPGGQLDQGGQRLSISTNAEFKSVEEIGDVVVGNAGGARVHVRDVADVVDSFAEETVVVRANGKSAVMLAVRRQSDANTVDVAARVFEALVKLDKQLPPGVTISPVMDTAKPISMSVANLASSAMTSIALTALILLVFLRSWRTATIVLASIPISMLATFAVMDSQSVTLNIISMAGLSLAVGMLVDNSIVVLENIFSRLQAGERLKDAAIKGTSEMAMPIIASTLTTVAVFAPILFVPGLAGQLFRDMSLTIVISLMCSLLVALTLVPLLASLVISNKGPNAAERMLGKLTGWLDPLADRYAGFLEVVMRHRGKTLLLTLVAFVGIMAMSPLMGVDFMAQTDQGMVNLTLKAAPGTSLDSTRALFARAEKIVSELVPEAEVTVSQFGGGDGFTALFGQNSSSGQLQMRLTPMAERSRSQFEIQDQLLEALASIPGLEVTATAPPGFGGSNLLVKVYGDDLDKAREHGSRLKSALQVAPGASNVTFDLEGGEPEMSIDVDREQSRLLGLSAAEVASTISTYFLGTTATMYREGGEEYDVKVRAPKAVREDLDQLRALPVTTATGQTVPLQTVANIQQSQGLTSIKRENQRRMATVSLDPAEGVALGDLMTSVNAVLAANPAPAGVSVQVAGAAEDIAESFMALAFALLIAVLLVYMVMASQFESLLEPFVILFSIPLAMAGVVLGLVLTGTTFQVTAMIGMILLAGIVVNNGIVLVDVLKIRREEGMDLVQASMEAGRSRLRPILMTTLTTILGMIPMSIESGDGAEMWVPMARAVMGGMVVSSVLTLVVVPVGYVVLAGWVDGRRAKKAAARAANSDHQLDNRPPAQAVG